MKRKLTDAEFKTISILTSETHLNSVFDITADENNNDCFYDFEEDRYLSLEEGLNLLYEALAYPMVHDGLNSWQAQLVVDLFREFGIGNEDAYNWLLGPDE